ncbi:MAG: hypothetical protein AUJ70_03385 [Candidatus Omnitrophica bacterium CG1_02_40_15]|nr:MAG: hypothetical protein AUJ70_03385 [Candidatus Omnitrophica bacterium CG1_02_40_15]
MMTKKLTCIECPKGCRLIVDVEDGKVAMVTGNECPKGEKYAVSEIENPARILTSSVLSQGFGLKMIPVRTDKPMPKSRIFDAMNEVRKIRVTTPLKSEDIIVKNFLGLGVNLIATRKAE